MLVLLHPCPGLSEYTTPGFQGAYSAVIGAYDDGGTVTVPDDPDFEPSTVGVCWGEPDGE